MDLILICKDASTSSLLDTLLTSIEAKKNGAEVLVLFTQEALVAIAGGTFAWPRGLLGQKRRYLMADNGAKRGLPVSGVGQLRQLDYRQVLENARQAGVPMAGLSTWVDLLDLGDRLPSGMKVVQPKELLDIFGQAKSIVGSL